MKSLSKNDITIIQMIFLFMLSILTLAFVDLHGIAKYIEIDAWLPSLFALFISPFFIWTSVKLASYFPDQMIVSYLPLILGKYLGYAVAFAISLYYLLVSVVVLKFFAEFAQVFIVPKTPTEFITLLPIVVIFYAVIYGIQSIGKMAEATISLIILFFILLLLAVLQVDYSNILPIAAEGWIPVIAKISYALPYYIPPVGAITFLYPFLNRKEKVMKPFIYSTLIAGSIVVFLNLSIVGMVGYEISDLYFPAITLFQRIAIAVTFFERIAKVLLLIILPFSIIFNLLHFFISVLGFTSFFRIKEPVVFTILLLPVYYLLSNLPLSVAEGFFLREIARFYSLFILFLPSLLLFILWIQKKRRHY